MAGLAIAMVGPVGRSRRIAVSVAVGGSVLLAFTALTIAGRSQIDSDLDSTAVILDESVQVHSGPGIQYPTEFEIHAGAETELLEVRGAWARISIAAPQLQGWVPNTTLETVLLAAIPWRSPGGSTGSDKAGIPICWGFQATARHRHPEPCASELVNNCRDHLFQIRKATVDGNWA